MEGSTQVAAESETIGVGKHPRHGRDPLVALGLAILIGVLVFALLMKLRKTFGLKE